MSTNIPPHTTYPPFVIRPTVGKDGQDWYCIYSQPDEGVVLEVNHLGCVENVHIAALFAAAPDLLAVCKRVKELVWLHGGLTGETAYNHIIAAIAKAEGTQ